MKRREAQSCRVTILLLASVCALFCWSGLALAQAVNEGSAARILVDQGDQLRARDEYAAARESYRHALELAERGGDTAEAGALLGLGELYVLQVKFSYALEALQQSLALSQSVGDGE